MTAPIPTRFSADELASIDALVSAGVGKNRSDVIRHAVALLAQAQTMRRQGESIAASYRELPQTSSDDAAALANALALTEAESW